MAGSLIFKTGYAPDFPIVALSQISSGRTTTVAVRVEKANLIAPEPACRPPVFPPQICPRGPEILSLSSWSLTTGPQGRPEKRASGHLDGKGERSLRFSLLFGRMGQSKIQPMETFTQCLQLLTLKLD
jgi:hypothetical protein